MDPISLYQLAETLHMPVGEMCERMSVQELTQGWPAYLSWKSRQRKQHEEKSQGRR